MHQMYAKLQIYPVLLTALLLLSGCMAGGGPMSKGGEYHTVYIAPGATMTHGSPYQYICYDRKEAERREQESEETGVDNSNMAPPVYYVEPSEYDGSCSVEGESSAFFLLNMFPTSSHLDPQYAIATAVQSLEGDTMINIRAWHETHFYSFLGRVSVFKVRGDVIKFK